MDDDHSEAIEVIANRKLAERERKQGVSNPDYWVRAVVAGIRRDHAGRIATMPDGLSLADQVRWIEYGPSADGARIPPPEQPLVVHDLMPVESWRAGIDQCRALLRKENHADSIV